MSTSELEKELEAKHKSLDLKIKKIAKDNGYGIIDTWNGYPVYRIPTHDLLGVRSASYCRRKKVYTQLIKESLQGRQIQKAPLLCFVAGDLMLRVKWGNLIFWIAKETRNPTHLACVFPGSAEKTEKLSTRFLEEYKLPPGSLI